MELWPVTAAWMVGEHLGRSLPLALGRWGGLRRFVEAGAGVDGGLEGGLGGGWNALTGPEQRKVLFLGFGGVWVLHLLLVAGIGLPAMMVARRFYASMLSEADFAIVPFYRGRPRRRSVPDSAPTTTTTPTTPTTSTTATTATTTTTNSTSALGRESEQRLRKPGLSVSEAWGTITWRQYGRVLAVYGGWVVLDQVVRFLFWWGGWEAQRGLGVEGYRGRVPGGGVGGVEGRLWDGFGFGWSGWGVGRREGGVVGNLVMLAQVRRWICVYIVCFFNNDVRYYRIGNRDVNAQADFYCLKLYYQMSDLYTFLPMLNS